MLGCTGLTDITISDSVTAIGLGAFFCCKRLVDISISDNVTEIEDNAFLGCENPIINVINDSCAEVHVKENAILLLLRNISRLHHSMDSISDPESEKAFGLVCRITYDKEKEKRKNNVLPII